MPSLSKKVLVRGAVGGAVTLAVLVGGIVWWQGRQSYETTDNAFVQADTVQVAPQVSGYVAEVLVEDNARVIPGQVLVKLDSSTFEAKLAQAEANAQALEAAIKSVDDKAVVEKAMIAQKAAGVVSAEAQASWAKSELDRYGALSKQGWVSSQRAQNARAAADQADAAVRQAQATLKAEQVSAQSLSSNRAQTVAQAAAARAAVEQARIDLERTVIRAPVAGVVGAKGVRTGQLVQPGLSLMAVVPLGETYVVANFKETQVSRLRIGQPVELHADAFGKTKIKGRSDSFSPATGAQFALIPVENAVGNFTKIAQRVPVKIAVDAKSPQAGALRPGLSVEVKVDVRERTGPSFAEAAQLEPRYARDGVSR